jgi:tetratricopeptide (TPR) repeat protein
MVTTIIIIKIKLKMKNIISALLLCFWSFVMFGQVDNRPNIETVEIEGLLIEAKKEVLLNNFDEAIMIYKGIITKDKSNATAYYEMAKTYGALDQIKEAKVAGKQAFLLDKTNEWYGIYHAGFLVDDGSYQDAADVYENIIIANAKNSTYYYQRAYLLTKVKKYDDAIKVYEDLEAQDGTDERSSRQKHTIYNLMGKPAKAAEALEELIAVFPMESQYYHVLAQYYEAQGKGSKAKEVYERALKVNANDPVASIALAESMKASGNEAQYLLGLKPLFNREEVNIDLKVQELYPYIIRLPNVKSGVPEALVELSKTMTEVHPKDAKAFAIYADILYYTGNPQAALPQYYKTLELDNSVFSVWEQVLVVNQELGQSDELLKASEDAMDLFPSQAFVYYMNGAAHNQKGKFDAAIGSLDEAMMMSGRDNTMKVKVASELGVSYYGQKDYVVAEDWLKRALDNGGGNDAQILEHYGDVLFQLGKKEDALTYWQKAKKMGSDSKFLNQKILEKKIIE